MTAIAPLIVALVAITAAAVPAAAAQIEVPTGGAVRGGVEEP
jgi:hypothetical protein